MGKTENLETLEKMEGRGKREILVPLEEKALMVPKVNVELLVILDCGVLPVSQDRSVPLARVSLVSQEVWVPRVTVERLDPKGNRAFLENVAYEENLGACRMQRDYWKQLASRCRPCGTLWRPGVRALAASSLCLNGDLAPRGTLVSEALLARRVPSAFLESVG